VTEELDPAKAVVAIIGVADRKGIRGENANGHVCSGFGPFRQVQRFNTRSGPCTGVQTGPRKQMSALWSCTAACRAASSIVRATHNFDNDQRAALSRAIVSRVEADP
jgi:hypothetical protein